MTIEPIGVIKTPYRTLSDMPIQPKGAQMEEATLVVDPALAAGLKDLEGFSHIYLIYYFHQTDREALEVVPFMDVHTHGVYATRSPLRPNHIGLSIVRLIGIDHNRVTIQGVDILDGTPLLDIKPYIEAFDKVESSYSGWMSKSSEQVAQARSDSRFI